MKAFLLRHYNKLKLKHKFALTILGNIILVLIVFSVIILQYQERKLNENYEEKNLSLAKNLANEAIDSLLVREYLKLDTLVNSSQEAILCKYAYIVDSFGRVVAHTDKNKLGQYLSLPETESLTKRDRKINGLTIRDYIVPIKIRKELLGYSVLGVKKYKEANLVKAHLIELRNKLILIAGFLLFLGMLSSYFMAGLLTKRISLLKSKMSQVQKGDLNLNPVEEEQISCGHVFNCSHKSCPAYGQKRCWTFDRTFYGQHRDCFDCPVYKRASGDEIGELHLAFNQMVCDLRKNIDKLEKTTLEKSRLERLSMLGQMSAQVAHEIKNPLNAIKGSAHYLRENFTGEILQEFLEVIEMESDRLNDIVKNFLNFSKPGPTKKQFSDLLQMVRDSLKLVQDEAKDKNIILDFNPQDDPRPFKFDYAKVKQAFLNLVVNAVQATGSGGKISVTTAIKNEEIHLKVQDTGPGIDDQCMEEIFKPFFTSKVRGSGLGLAIAEQNIREHNGRIEVTSQKNQGTLFTIILPLREQ